MACRLWATFRVYLQRLLGHQLPGQPLRSPSATVNYRSFKRLQFMLKLYVPCMNATHCTASSQYSCCSTRRQPKSRRALQKDLLLTKLREGNTGTKTIILNLNTSEQSLKPRLLTLSDSTTAVSCFWSHPWSSQSRTLLSTTSSRPLWFPPNPSNAPTYIAWCLTLSSCTLLMWLAGQPRDSTHCSSSGTPPALKG